MPEPTQSVPSPVSVKGAGDAARPIRDFWQWLGMTGDGLGTSGILRRTFLYALGVAIVSVAAFNAVNVITLTHEEPQLGLAGPIIWEATSWVTLILFFWIPWVAYRLAPPNVRPRWMLAVHIPTALLFSLAHVEGFVLLRRLIYWLAGSRYEYGAFLQQFAYEFRKDIFGYVLFTAGFALIGHLLRQQQLIATPGQTLTFDIRDGARLIRVRLDEVLAISSAGNYVEFVLGDGRKPMMRSPLSALQDELAPRGFVRTHRSWLVNAARVTGLRPEGSGDYTVEISGLSVPLSRRYPEALARLRSG